MSLLSTKYRSGTKVVHQLFTANGTWTKPAKFIEGTLTISGIGGGASGPKIASKSIGGNGGEFVVDKYVDVSASSSVSVTIGAGGASVTGTAPLAGNSGSPTTFGALLTLSGGIGAASTGEQGATVGGSIGGISSQGGSGTYALPNPIHCHYAGACGYQNTGDDTYTSSNTANGNGGGGNGLVLSDTGVKGGDVTAGGTIVYGGIGYGAGGASSGTNNSGAGAQGALYLTWQEYV